MKKRIPKSECTQKTEWDRPILKILTFSPSQSSNLVKAFSFFFFFSFFWQAIWTGSGWMGQTGFGDVIHDIIRMFWHMQCVGTLKRVVLRFSACERVNQCWWIPNFLVARSGVFGPEILMFFRYRAVEDPCRVSFVKLWAGLHIFEGLGRGSLRDYGNVWWLCY